LQRARAWALTGTPLENREDDLASILEFVTSLKDGEKSPRFNPGRELRAGGQGLNLQDASYVFHFDRWWNPAVELQAEGRAHRLGQAFPVHIYKYTIEDTIEERIEKILAEKQLLFDELVNNVSLDLKSKLSSKELFGLFGLVPPANLKASKGAQGALAASKEREVSD